VDARSSLEQRRLLAAIAAALLGSQGSPVWSRTAERVIRSSTDAESHYQRVPYGLGEIPGADTLDP
jgi:hypothetical protein